MRGVGTLIWFSTRLSRKFKFDGRNFDFGDDDFENPLASDEDEVSQRHLPPYFLGHFSPVLRRLFAVLLRFPASWRQDGENGRKMA